MLNCSALLICVCFGIVRKRINVVNHEVTAYCLYFLREAVWCRVTFKLEFVLFLK